MAAKKNITAEDIQATVDNTVETVKKAAKKAGKATKKVVEETKEGLDQAKKTTTRKKTVKGNVFVQWDGREFSSEELLLRVKQIWVEELGNTASSFKEANVYVKPEDNAAYYVVNGEVSGSFILD